MALYWDPVFNPPINQKPSVALKTSGMKTSLCVPTCDMNASTGKLCVLANGLLGKVLVCLPCMTGAVPAAAAVADGEGAKNMSEDDDPEDDAQLLVVPLLPKDRGGMDGRVDGTLNARDNGRG